MIASLVLLLIATVGDQGVPSGWKVVKDAKGACQISVPPDWVPLPESDGAAVFRNTTTGIVVVTSQPGQTFKPLTASLQKVLGISKDRMFENSARRTFYQDKVSQNAEDTNSFSASVPGKEGTCSCRAVVLPLVPQETARQIILSLGPVAE
jgi:hypothetical protein